MMKRILACAVAVACLLTACATFALADGIAMKVIKVNEAVNMRQQTNTDSAIVGKVPKGTVLEGCTPVEGSQWIAVTYQGIAGYIRGDFLEPVDGSAPAAAPAAPAAAPASGAAAADADVPAVTGSTPVENPPVANINQATDYNDDFVILDQNVNGVRVMARQIFTKTNEYLMIVGLDGNGDQIWKRETATEDISEMTQTEAFMGGTAAMPPPNPKKGRNQPGRTTPRPGHDGGRGSTDRTRQHNYRHKHSRPKNHTGRNNGTGERGKEHKRQKATGRGERGEQRRTRARPATGERGTPKDKGSGRTQPGEGEGNGRRGRRGKGGGGEEGQEHN